MLEVDGDELLDTEGDKLLDPASAEVQAGTKNKVLLLEAAANADVEGLVSAEVLVNAVSATIEGSGGQVLAMPAVLGVDGDKLLDSAGAAVRVGAGSGVAIISVVIDHVDTHGRVPTAVADADNDASLLKTFAVGVRVPVILDVLDHVITWVAAARVEESDVLRLKAAANVNVEVLVPSAVLVNADSATVKGLGVPEFPEMAADVNTSAVASRVAENEVLLLEAAADADMEGLVPSALLVNAVSATNEG